MGSVMNISEDKAQRRNLTTLFRDQRYDCLEVEYGARALRLIPTRNVECVISDIKLTVISGIQLLFSSMAKLLIIDDNQPVPHLRRNDDLHPGILGTGKRLVARQVLSKPFDIQTLLPMVSKAFHDPGRIEHAIREISLGNTLMPSSISNIAVSPQFHSGVSTTYSQGSMP